MKWLAFAAVCWFLISGSTAEVGAQMQDFKKLRLSVFRVDAATAAAQELGLFVAENLIVETSATPNSTDQMRGLSQAKLDIVSTAFDNVLAWSGREGTEIVAIAQISDKTVLPVFVRPEIKTWGDLKGKKLAADAVDTAFALVLRRVLLAHGLDMTKGDYELVALGAGGTRLESMIKGETVAGVLNPPFDIKALEAGMRRIGDSKEVLPDYPNTVFAIARESVQNNRETVLAFLRAWLKARAWVKDPVNCKDALRIVGSQLKLNPKQAAESIDELSSSGN
jgi:ABC-type nitrate/sulfonate/bicarbonate transport system substrate-binding protein